MNNIANLLFEINILKKIPRSGYQFLGAGKESVAEHLFTITFIAYVMSKMEPDVDALKLISMCLVHDIPEARTGDLNYVQKQYVLANEAEAIKEIVKNLPFGESLEHLIREFNEGESPEAKLAHDADQLALMLDLKALSDTGCRTAVKWLSHIHNRLQTATGNNIAESIMKTDKDDWWEKKSIDRKNINK